MIQTLSEYDINAFLIVFQSNQGQPGDQGLQGSKGEKVTRDLMHCYTSVFFKLYISNIFAAYINAY